MNKRLRGNESACEKEKWSVRVCECVSEREREREKERKRERKEMIGR